MANYVGASQQTKCTKLALKSKTCACCELAGKFQCTQKSNFKDLVTIPGIKLLLGWRNTTVLDDTNPAKVEQKMMEIVDKYWDFTNSDTETLEPPTKPVKSVKPAEVAKRQKAADCEEKTRQVMR